MFFRIVYVENKNNHKSYYIHHVHMWHIAIALKIKQTIMFFMVQENMPDNITAGWYFFYQFIENFFILCLIFLYWFKFCKIIYVFTNRNIDNSVRKLLTVQFIGK